MQALLPTDAPEATLSSPAHKSPNQSLGSDDLWQLGERLRVAYGPVEPALPVRLAELVERLERRDQGED